MQTNDDDNTRFMISMAINQEFRRTQSQRTRRGLSAAAEHGFFVSSKAPYGYRKIPVDDYGRQRATLELDPTASETVRRIFDSSSRE